MKASLIISQHGLSNLRDKNKPRAFLDNIEILTPPGSDELGSEIDRILGAWEEFRYEQGNATRKNDPYSFGRYLLSSDTLEEDVCAIVLSNEAKICGILQGVLLKNRIKHSFAYFKIPTLKLTELRVEPSAVLVDGERETLLVMNQLLEEMAGAKIFDLILQNYLEKDSDWYRTLQDNDNKKWLTYEIPHTRWVLPLLDPVTREPVKHNSSKTRSKQRRQDRVLKDHFDGDIEFQVITEQSQVDEFINDAFYILQHTYHAKRGDGISIDDVKTKEYLCELANNGMLRCYMLKAKGQPLSYSLGDLCFNTYYGRKTGFLPEYSKISPGTFLLRRIIEDLVDNGVMNFDLGWGEYDYKRILGANKSLDCNLYMYASRLKPNLVFRAGSLLSSSERLIKQYAGSMGLTNSIRRTWRNISTQKNKKTQVFNDNK